MAATTAAPWAGGTDRAKPTGPGLGQVNRVTHLGQKRLEFILWSSSLAPKSANI